MEWVTLYICLSLGSGYCSAAMLPMGSPEGCKTAGQSIQRHFERGMINRVFWLCIDSNGNVISNNGEKE